MTEFNLDKNNFEFRKTDPKSELKLEGNDWQLPNDPSLIHSAVTALENRLADVGWSKEKIGDFPIAFDEALTNTVIHGNLGLKKGRKESQKDFDQRIATERTKEQNRSKIVKVTLKISTDKAVIHIQDEGPGFKPEQILDPTSTERVMETSGRGIRLIQGICDGFEVRGNGVILIKLRKTS